MPHLARRLPRILSLVALVAASIGCEESGPRIYTARHYRPDVDCLASYAPLALVEADKLPSTCEPTCLRVGEDLYVSTVCAPYPTEAVVEAPDLSPTCQRALVLLASPSTCDASGGADDLDADVPDDASDGAAPAEDGELDAPTEDGTPALEDAPD